MPALSVVTLWKLQQSLPTRGSSNHPSAELEGSFLRLLSVICICAVFPVIMLILQFLRRWFYLWIDQLCTECHLRTLFQDNRIMHRLIAILSPGKRTMILT